MEKWAVGFHCPRKVSASFEGAVIPLPVGMKNRGT